MKPTFLHAELKVGMYSETEDSDRFFLRCEYPNPDLVTADKILKPESTKFVWDIFKKIL